MRDTFHSEEALNMIRAHGSLVTAVNTMEHETDPTKKDRLALCILSGIVRLYEITVPEDIRKELPYKPEEVTKKCCEYLSQRGIRVTPQMSIREINEIAARLS